MTADSVGGVWSYALSLAGGLERNGVHVTIAVMGGPVTPEQRAAALSHRNIALLESDFRLEWMQHSAADVAAAGEWLLGLERAVRPDVVHLNGYVHAALPWTAPVLVVAHSCVCSWWRAVHGCPAPAAWDVYRAGVAAGLRAARLVAAPTRAMLDALVREYGPIAAARVIPNGCDAWPLPLGPRDAFGRYRRRPRRAHPLVLAAGRIWDEAKNLQTLAAAAPDLRWPVYIAGPRQGPDGSNLQLDGVHLLGNVAPAAMLQWQRRASIFVHPALYEPFGLAPLEAALAGAALVLGDIPSLREVWGDAVTWVPPRDAAALARSVNTLADQPLLLAERSAAAHARARRFTAAAMARAYHVTYRQLLARDADQPQEAMACAS